MRLGWVTAADENAFESRDLFREIAKRCELRVIRLNSHHFASQRVSSVMAQYDVVLYDCRGSFPCRGEMFALQQIYPGIIILNGSEGDVSIRSAIGIIADADVTTEFEATYPCPIHRLSPSASASEILEFVDQVRNARLLLQVADSVSFELSRMGIARNSTIVDTVSQKLRQLFVGEHL